MARHEYDEALLRQLWAEGRSHSEIAAALGCPETMVSVLRRRYALPSRRRRHHGPSDYEPTPEEIAAHCERFKERHLDQKRQEPMRWRDKDGGADDCFSNVRRFQWDGYGFTPIG